METDNVVLEHLRKMRAQMDRMEHGIDDIREQIIGIRMREHADRGEDINRDQRLARLEAEMDQVRRRLELID